MWHACHFWLDLYCSRVRNEFLERKILSKNKLIPRNRNHNNEWKDLLKHSLHCVSSLTENVSYLIIFVKAAFILSESHVAQMIQFVQTSYRWCLGLIWDFQKS